MSDLPEIKNEPTVEMPRGEFDEFARGVRSALDQRVHHDDRPRKSPFRVVPALLAILLAIVGGWHWIAQDHLEKRLTSHFGKVAQEDMPDITVVVEVHPLTNLVEIQITRNVGRKEAAFEFFADAIIEYVRQEIEPKIERELSIAARRDVDLYAMMVPYKVSISIDKVREPPAPPPSRMVQEIQRELNARGYDAGPADGRLGRRTREVILRFQRDNGLTDDGRATGDLLDTLRKQ